LLPTATEAADWPPRLCDSFCRKSCSVTELVLDEALVDEALAVVLVVLVLPLEVPCASLTSFWKSDCSVDSALLDDVFPLFSCEIRLCRPDARSEP
jgi:hypothetical protein